MQISNSAAIYNYKLFKNNLFDTNYKICGDYDFIIKKSKKNQSKNYQYIVSFVKYGGISILNPKKAIDESLRCRLKYYKSNPINIMLIMFFVLIRYLKLIIKLVLENKFN